MRSCILDIQTNAKREWFINSYSIAEYYEKACEY
jgi:hypothetical protein